MTNEHRDELIREELDMLPPAPAAAPDFWTRLSDGIKDIDADRAESTIVVVPARTTPSGVEAEPDETVVELRPVGGGTPRQTPWLRPMLAAAAAVVIVAGLASVFLLGNDDPEPTAPTIATESDAEGASEDDTNESGRDPQPEPSAEPTGEPLEEVEMAELPANRVLAQYVAPPASAEPVDYIGEFEQTSLGQGQALGFTAAGDGVYIAVPSPGSDGGSCPGGTQSEVVITPLAGGPTRPAGLGTGSFGDTIHLGSDYAVILDTCGGAANAIVAAVNADGSFSNIIHTGIPIDTNHPNPVIWPLANPVLIEIVLAGEFTTDPATVVQVYPATGELLGSYVIGEDDFLSTPVFDQAGYEQAGRYLKDPRLIERGLFLGNGTTDLYPARLAGLFGELHLEGITLTDGGMGWGAWAPGSTAVAFSGDGYFVHSIETGVVVPLGDQRTTAIFFGPDGRHVLTTEHNQGDGSRFGDVILTTFTDSVDPDARFGQLSTVSSGGIANLRVGSTIEEVEADIGFKLTASPSELEIFGGDCYHVPIGPYTTLVFEQGVFRAVKTGAPGHVTPSGISVGTSEADLVATFPGQLDSTEHIYDPAITIYTFVPNDPTDTRNMVFTVHDGTVGSMAGGEDRWTYLAEGCA